MKNDQYLTTTELAGVFGLPRATVDGWRKPPPRYKWNYNQSTRTRVRIEVPQPPRIRWCKEDGRIVYHIVDVEACLEKDMTLRGAERLSRFRQLLKSRSESDSVSLEGFMVA